MDTALVGFGQYDSLLRQLLRLRQEFQELADLDLFHQQIVPELVFSEQQWSEFIKANSTTNPKESWQLWKGHPGGEERSRFWGCEDAFAAFEKLARRGIALLTASAP